MPRGDAARRGSEGSAALARPLERLGAWLAVHRLRRVPVLLLDDPLRNLAAAEVPDALNRIRDAVETDTVTVMVTRDALAGQTVADVLLRIVGRHLVAVPTPQPASQEWRRTVWNGRSKRRSTSSCRA